MKRICLLLLNLILSGFLNITYADYPIVSHSYLADPGALVYNGRVYVYCSNDNENGDDGYSMKSIVCVSSSDLKNWTDHGVVFRVPDNASWAGLSWAPSAAYRNGQFYLYFANGASNIGVAVSDSPTGPFVDPRGSSLVNGSTPGIQPSTNMWLFDPMTFIDDDGQAYLYCGGNGDDNLRVIRLNEDMISTNGSAGRFNVPNFFEAAWVHKHNGIYYFSYSTTPAAGMRIDYMTSDNPMSGFTYRGVLSPQPPNNNNNNHQATFQLNGQWYQMYHNRIVAAQNGDGTVYHRNLAIDRFVHNADGSIQQMVNTVDGVQQVHYLDPYVRAEAETMSNQLGIETEVCSAGGMNLAYLDNNDWIMVEGVDFGSAGAGGFSASVASDKTGGTIEIRLGGPTGTLIGTLQVPNTGGFQNWRTEVTSVNQTTGVHDVYFVFKGSSSSLFNIDHWSFFSSGPIVNITSPLSSDLFFEGDNITIEATAVAQEGSVKQVEFFVDGQSICVDNTAPYSCVYTNSARGTHIITVVATDSQGDEGSKAVTVSVNIPQGPYNNTLHPIPGTIQLEEFDIGGNGFAYYDNSPGSETGVNFRTDEDVDIEECTDAGGGYNIGWATAGEWLEYSVDVLKPGTYALSLRVACNGDGRTLSVTVDGDTIAGNLAIPNTAGWQTWQTVTVNDINLKAGNQIMRVTIGTADYINLNYATYTLTKELIQEPFNGTSHQIPGRIEAEEYDLGGEGLAYHEANVNGNEGGATLRNDEVDIEATQDATGNYNVGYVLNGEWLEYTVDVAAERSYELDLRVAADGDGKILHVEIDGIDVTGPVSVPNTGGWQVWETVTLSGINLTEGEHVMRIVFDSDYMNLNYAEFRDVVTGIGNSSSAGLKVSPNPFSEEGLQISKEGVFNYRITDVSGSVLEVGQSENEWLAGSRLSPGVYFLTVKDSKRMWFHKIIKH